MLANLGDHLDKVMVVTDPELMRGFDYRCKSGIDLLICRPFDHDRAYEQGIGRVGRYDEPSKLFIVPGICQIDAEKQLQHMTQLAKLVERK